MPITSGSLPLRALAIVIGIAILICALGGDGAAIVSGATRFDPGLVLSSLGTLALAGAVHHLLRRLGMRRPVGGTALALLLPSVLANAAFGTNDAMWAAPLIMALAAALDRRNDSMLAYCSLAFALDPQALLVAPLFVALLINRHAPLLRWPTAMCVAVATLAVARAALSLDANAALSDDAPNIWSIVQALPLGDTSLLGLAIAAAIGMTAAFTAHVSSRPLGDRALPSAALLAPLLTAGLLPEMHGGAFFFADIVALALALTAQDRQHWINALLVQSGSTLALIAASTGIAWFAMLGAAAMIAATVRLAGPLIKPAANDNPLLARASLTLR